MEKKNKHLGNKPKDNTCGDVPSTSVGCNDNIRRLGKLGDGTRGSLTYEHKLVPHLRILFHHKCGKKQRICCFLGFFLWANPWRDLDHESSPSSRSHSGG